MPRQAGARTNPLLQRTLGPSISTSGAFILQCSTQGSAYCRRIEAATQEKRTFLRPHHGIAEVPTRAMPAQLRERQCEPVALERAKRSTDFPILHAPCLELRLDAPWPAATRHSRPGEARGVATIGLPTPLAKHRKRRVDLFARVATANEPGAQLGSGIFTPRKPGERTLHGRPLAGPPRSRHHLRPLPSPPRAAARPPRAPAASREAAGRWCRRLQRSP